MYLDYFLGGRIGDCVKVNPVKEIFYIFRRLSPDWLKFKANIIDKLIRCTEYKKILMFSVEYNSTKFMGLNISVGIG